MEQGRVIAKAGVVGVSSHGALREAAVERISEIERVVKSIPALRRSLFSNAALGRVSPRQAIKAKCQECVCYENVIERVRSCGVIRCPLWMYRPYQDKVSQ